MSRVLQHTREEEQGTRDLLVLRARLGLVEDLPWKFVREDLSQPVQDNQIIAREYSRQLAGSKLSSFAASLMTSYVNSLKMLPSSLKEFIVGRQVRKYEAINCFRKMKYKVQTLRRRKKLFILIIGYKKTVDESLKRRALRQLAASLQKKCSAKSHFQRRQLSQIFSWLKKSSAKYQEKQWNVKLRVKSKWFVNWLHCYRNYHLQKDNKTVLNHYASQLLARSFRAVRKAALKSTSIRKQKRLTNLRLIRRCWLILLRSRQTRQNQLRVQMMSRVVGGYEFVKAEIFESHSLLLLPGS